MNRQAKDQVSSVTQGRGMAPDEAARTNAFFSQDKDHGVEAEQAKRLLTEEEELGILGRQNVPVAL